MVFVPVLSNRTTPDTNTLSNIYSTLVTMTDVWYTALRVSQIPPTPNSGTTYKHEDIHLWVDEQTDIFMRFLILSLYSKKE